VCLNIPADKNFYLEAVSISVSFLHPRGVLYFHSGKKITRIYSALHIYFVTESFSYKRFPTTKRDTAFLQTWPVYVYILKPEKCSFRKLRIIDILYLKEKSGHIGA
jgi:hypothetical protein